MRKLKRDKCVVLPLVLKRKWYDMIECGEKKIEYRRASYWLFRVSRWFRRCIDSDGRLVPVVEFRHGYAKDRRRSICFLSFFFAALCFIFYTDGN